MDELEAAYYVKSLHPLCKQMLIKGSVEHWTTSDIEFDRALYPFIKTRDLARHLEASNLVECQQSRLGNRFSHLSIRLNERGNHLKNYMRQIAESAEGRQ